MDHSGLEKYASRQTVAYRFKSVNLVLCSRKAVERLRVACSSVVA